MMREVTPKRLIPQVSSWEKAVGCVAPGLAKKIYQTRCAFAMTEAYHGASKTRKSMTGLNAPSGDFNTDVLPELETLRENSEHLYRNNMLAAGGINAKAISVIGRGLTAQPRIDAEYLGMSEEAAEKLEAHVARRWAMFSESKFCSINKRHNFRQIISLGYLSSLIRGDSFLLTPEKEKLNYFPFKLRLQLVEADRVCNADNVADDKNLAGGIQTDDNGAPLYVHIRTSHPGSMVDTELKWQRVRWIGEKTGRRNVLQFYKPVRVDGHRGVPLLAPVIEGLKQFSTLTQATIDAAVVQTFLSVLIETPSGDPIPLESGNSTNSVKLDAAAIIDLAEGEKPHVINPTHPNSNYPLFYDKFTTQLGAAIGVPKEVIEKYFQSSYTAAQGALLEAWREFTMERWRIIDDICQPVYELWLAGEVADGEIIMPGFFSSPDIRAAYSGVDWAGPPRGHIREDIQNKADGYAEDRGWKTSEQNTQERGSRWERNLRQRKKEIQSKIDAGITEDPNAKQQDITAQVN